MTGLVQERQFPADTEDFMEGCRSFIGAVFLEVTRLDTFRDHGAVVAWVDEDGLENSATGSWSAAGAPAPIAGRFVLTNVDDDGEPTTLSPSLDEVMAAIEMHGMEDQEFFSPGERH